MVRGANWEKGGRRRHCDAERRALEGLMECLSIVNASREGALGAIVESRQSSTQQAQCGRCTLRGKTIERTAKIEFWRSDKAECTAAEGRSWGCISRR
jgi:hypothetical protein